MCFLIKLKYQVIVVYLAHVCFMKMLNAYSYFMPVWGIVKTTASRCRGQLDALLPETERPRVFVHRAVHGTEGQ